MSGTQASTVVALPQEIWWLVSQEFTSRRDFLSLFNLARVNRSMAKLALPLLYSIHELSPASTGDTAIVDTKKWAVLWRSILASSLGGAMYSYCLWIKSLSLGNLHSLLEDLARDQYKDIRTWFFGAPLERFHILQSRASNVATRRNRALMDIESIIFEVANQITDFIKTSATEHDKTVGLTSLEGYHLPTARLPRWVSRLSLLTSLAVRDGSVLNSTIAEAIRENCPHFRELVCHYCVGPDVDDDLAGFLSSLSPNTLQSFTIMSANRVGAITHAALGRHSSSLSQLSLYVEDSAVAGLPFLSDCTNLVDLTLDVCGTVPPLWEQTHKEEVRQIASWLQQCTSLKKLSVINLPSTLSILAEVLKVPGIRLTDLEITMQTIQEDTSAFSSAMATQSDLKTFIFRSRDGWFGGSEFIHAICQCTKLRKLDIVTQMLKIGDFYKVTDTMKDVEEFAFDIDSDEPIGDECVYALGTMHQLKTLTINATTAFTYQGLLALFENLGSDPLGSHQGLSIHIMRQVGTQKFSQAQVKKLNAALSKQLGGKMEITYDADPDELNESDFSD
ncbi:hypothetical protein CONLIGDRAFT_677392 [Coniochaeta ligniaria NRRL 30616]|uniref:F-box domain-containing protein n=1 Tax=Coniochaeta ligniaria NRRL 30616 TaxID=1408157 RepID=A0A1J7JJS4_9PEZI|nr:hypothetical protein CONLIGDRAFT_677392 [Coniochaeta ligniaria NRRL 30616]